MKVTKLTIKNIGKIADVSIELNKPLILFYGEIMAGKTTILNAIKWCFGGSFPSDIIQHGKEDAKVRLEFEGGSISREWYRGKDGETKAREIVFIRNGVPVKKPVSEIEKFLNPFLLDQDHLRNMGETERKSYFMELFGVDTSELDKELSQKEIEARDLRSVIKGYGEIDLTPVQPIDAASLKSNLQSIRDAHKKQLQDIEQRNGEIRKHNDTVARGKEKLETITTEIADLEKRLTEARVTQSKISAWLNSNSEQELLSIPNTPDTSELESKIAEAAANQVRVEQYNKNVARAAERTKNQQALSAVEKRQREIREEKRAKLKSISESCGIKDLVFDESGNFTYQGTQSGMLSTSQVMQLSSELSALYPEGFGLDLIDRGESLGKSIFLFVDRAKKEEKTILATIVGEKPATIPEDIGVFVVDNGSLVA